MHFEVKKVKSSKKQPGNIQIIIILIKGFPANFLMATASLGNHVKIIAWNDIKIDIEKSILSVENFFDETYF